MEPTITTWEARASVDLVRVHTSKEAYWLRIYSRSQETPPALEEEAAITAALAGEARVAAAVPSIDGGFVGTWNGYPTLLYREVPGTSVSSPSARQAANLGKLLATVHETGSRLVRSARRVDATTLGERALEHAAASLRACGFDETELRSIAGHMRHLVQRATLPSGFVHGDLHLENVHFDADSPYLIDFACSGDGPFAYDLACYWRKRLLTQASDTPPADWNSLIGGYASVRPLTTDELAVIPALACLRAIWVMCLPSLPTSSWGAKWLTDPDYFAAHIAMITRFARIAAAWAT